MRKFPATGLLPGLLVAALLAIAVATVLAAAARVSWLAELATHFRLQYVAVLLVLTGAALLLRRGRLALVAVVVLIPNLWAVGPYLRPWVLPAPAASSSAATRSVVALNLLHRNSNPGEVARYLERAGPDVLVLSELTPVLLAALRPVLSAYPYVMAADQRGPWGLGVFSRFPLRDVRGTDLGVRGSFNVLATVEFPAAPLRLAAVHLASPTGPRAAALRNGQLQELARLLASVDPGLPRLLVGDLNTTPFSPHLADLLEQTRMRDSGRDHGYQGTWPSWFAPALIPIDLCIADPAANVREVRRGPDVGSDHYPLEVILQPAT